MGLFGCMDYIEVPEDGGKRLNIGPGKSLLSVNRKAAIAGGLSVVAVR